MENNNGKKTVMLVAFYNVKALGVRYLESALKAGGYDVVTVFFKGFNSANPQKCTNEELELLCSLIREHKPLFVGLSVMSSMYLDTVNDMISKLKAEFDIPLVTGGAFATLFPEYFLDRGVDFSTRADGERVTLKLANALKNNTPYEDILSLCYKKDGKNVINPIGDIAENIDEYGIPAVECMCAYSIEHNVLSKGDPQLSTLSYEVIASRGCPFTCSYCSVINLHRLMPNGTKAVRTRSVDSVIAELIEAKKKCKKLVFVHFYDEIFPNTPGWVDEFCEKYNKNIRIPFTIWSHPKMVDGEVLKKLRRVGLMEVIMGIQSGSDYIRKEIFHRYETREDIIKATNIIKDSKIFWASYDFMLQHPFETIDTLKETYYLVKDLRRPFELQLHGLNFLPGTDIVKMATDSGKVSEDEMQKIMYAPMEEQFSAYWKRENERESQTIYRMTYCLQFRMLRRKIESFESDYMAHADEIDKLFERGKLLWKIRYLRRKSRLVIRNVFKI